MNLKRSRALQRVLRHRLDFPLGKKKDAGEPEKGGKASARSISPGYRRLCFLSRIESASSTHTGALWRLTGRLSIAEFISFRISSLGYHCPPSRSFTPLPPSFSLLFLWICVSLCHPFYIPNSALFIPNHPARRNQSLIPILFPFPDGCTEIGEIKLRDGATVVIRRLHFSIMVTRGRDCSSVLRDTLWCCAVMGVGAFIMDQVFALSVPVSLSFIPTHVASCVYACEVCIM